MRRRFVSRFLDLQPLHPPVRVYAGCWLAGLVGLSVSAVCFAQGQTPVNVATGFPAFVRYYDLHVGQGPSTYTGSFNDYLNSMHSAASQIALGEYGTTADARSAVASLMTYDEIKQFRSATFGSLATVIGRLGEIRADTTNIRTSASDILGTLLTTNTRLSTANTSLNSIDLQLAGIVSEVQQLRNMFAEADTPVTNTSGVDPSFGNIVNNLSSSRVSELSNQFPTPELTPSASPPAVFTSPSGLLPTATISGSGQTVTLADPFDGGSWWDTAGPAFELIRYPLQTLMIALSTISAVWWVWSELKRE